MEAKKEEESKIIAMSYLYLVLAICQALPYAFFLGCFSTCILEIAVMPIFQMRKLRLSKKLCHLPKVTELVSGWSKS